jgi:hypothetical protein
MDGENDGVKLYKAMIWLRDPNRPGRRASVAKPLEEAKEKLEAEYGEGKLFGLHNEEDAARPR